MDEQAVEYAKKEFENLEAVVSVYSMSFVWVSEDFASALQYSQSEVNSIALRKVMALSNEEINKFIPMLVSGKHIPKDVRPFYRKDGTIVKGEASIEKFDFDGEPYLAVLNAVFKDAGEKQ